MVSRRTQSGARTQGARTEGGAQVSRVDIEALEALEKAATPWPWVGDRNWTIVGRGHDWERTWPKGIGADFRVCQVDGPSHENRAPEDYKLIPAMRNALPSILAELRAARVVVAESRAFIATYLAGGPRDRALREAISAYAAATGEVPR